jgi:23S rRNA (uracil1939-C5)-methyltransferase
MKNEHKSSNKKGKTNQPMNRADYSKANKKREVYDDAKNLEDFKTFVKETGWKKSGNQSTGKGNSTASRGAKSTSAYEQKGRVSKGAKSTSAYAQKGPTARGPKSTSAYAQKGPGSRGPKSESTYEQKGPASREQKSTSAYAQKSSDSRRDRSTSTGTQKKSTYGMQSGTSSTKKYSAASQRKEYTISDAKTPKSHNASSGIGKQDKPLIATEAKIRGACSYQRGCGGCNILHDSYAKHLEEKQKEVEKLLKKYCKVEPILGMKQPDHYRHKVHVVFDHDRKGNPISGVYEEGSHRVIAVERCLIHNEKADAIISSIRGMLKSFKILTFDEDTGYGLLRHVLVRSGYHSGEIMVVLVLASPIMPSKNNFVKALRKEHPEITTVVVNVNDKQTSMVLGDKEQVIYGKGFIEDSLCGKTFRISPKSFYQVNPAQTEVLYKKAIELADLSGNETVIDAYCGIGTIGLIASDHAKQVIGVELNKDAVRDAVVNAKLNEATNIEFYKNDAGEFMSQMASKGDTADVVFMDPPRNGSTPQFMDAVAMLKPSKIVYVSCNPVTLERDLEYLTKKGYKAHKAIPVDMFPWTKHCETIALLNKNT